MSDIIENNNEELEDDENYLTLTDDDGNDVSFEIIGSVEYSERIFLVAIPFDEEDEDLVIIEVIEGDDEDSEEFIAVEDEALATAVYEEFKKNYEGEYEFE